MRGYVPGTPNYEYSDYVISSSRYHVRPFSLGSSLSFEKVVINYPSPKGLPKTTKAVKKERKGD